MQKERDQQVLSHTRVARLDDQYREFSYFYNSSEIDDYIDYLQAAYPQTVEIDVIGESLEGRSIRCVKISASGRKVDGNRPIIFIDAGIHAREWATHMTVLQILQNLIEKTEEYSNLLDGIDWVVVPIVNPDGYHHTHKTVTIESTFDYWYWIQFAIQFSGSIVAEESPTNHRFPLFWRRSK